MENKRNPTNCDRVTNSETAKQILQTMIDEKIIIDTDGEIHQITTSAGNFTFKVNFSNNTIEEVYDL
jgi:hypothetical protein